MNDPNPEIATIIDILTTMYKTRDPALAPSKLDSTLNCLGHLDSVYLLYHLCRISLRKHSSLSQPIVALIKTIVDYLVETEIGLIHVSVLGRNMLNMLIAEEFGKENPTFPFVVRGLEFGIEDEKLRATMISIGLMERMISVSDMDELERIEYVLIALIKHILDSSLLVRIRLRTRAISTVQDKLVVSRYVPHLVALSESAVDRTSSSFVGKLMRWFVRMIETSVISEDLTAMANILDVCSGFRQKPSISLDLMPCMRYLSSNTRQGFAMFLTRVVEMGLAIPGQMENTIQMLLQKEEWELGRQMMVSYYKTRNVDVLIKKTVENCRDLITQTPIQLCNLEAAILALFEQIETVPGAEKTCRMYLERVGEVVERQLISRNKDLQMQVVRIVSVFGSRFSNETAFIEKILKIESSKDEK